MAVAGEGEELLPVLADQHAQADAGAWRRVGRVDVRRADHALWRAAAEGRAFHFPQIKAQPPRVRHPSRVTDAHLATPLGKPRARALGIPLPGRLGPSNAITDVPGVTAGYSTLIEGADVRTGVTAIHARQDHTVGVLVQANFGSRHELTIAGIPLGDDLAGDNPLGDWVPGACRQGIPRSAGGPGAGSIVAIVATDAPLLPHQCAALARRVTLGIARTGTTGSHFSGDPFLALSTGNPGAFAGQDLVTRAGGTRELRFLPWHALDPYFAAVVQATEEAVLNALVANEDMTGYRGHRVPALPRERIQAAMPC